MKRLAAPILLIFAASTGYMAFGIPHAPGPGGTACRIAFVIAVVGFLAAFIAQVASHLGATSSLEISLPHTHRAHRSKDPPTTDARPGDTTKGTPPSDTRHDTDHTSLPP